MEQESLIEYGSRRVIITITAILCALLEIVDTTIVNVALNDMKGNLGATLSEISWVVTAYAIGNVIIIPLTSWLSQQFGRRNYFAVSIAIFTICSFLCGNAHSMWELILFRFIQGAGGGALLVTSQTIITESYPPEKQGTAQGLYGLGVIVGPTLGPPLGGYIVDHWSWPYIFYINIPLGVVALMLTLQFVRSPKYGEKTSSKDIDWFGIITLAVAVGCLQFVLERGQEDDWFNDEIILTCSILSVISFYLFIWRELTAKKPIVNLRVLKNPSLAVGTVLMFVLGFGLYGSTFVFPIFTQNSLGWTAFQSGLLMIPATLVTAVMMPIVGAMLQKGIQGKYLAAMGMFLFFVYSFWGASVLSPTTGKDDFFWVLMLRGFALSLLFIPITVISLGSLKGPEIGEGASFTGMMRQLGGSFGIALITTYISRANQKHRIVMLQHFTPDNIPFMNQLNAFKANFIAQGKTPDQAYKAAVYAMEGKIGAQSVILSYMEVFQLLGFMFLICVPFILMIKKTSGPVNTSAGH